MEQTEFLLCPAPAWGRAALTHLWGTVWGPQLVLTSKKGVNLPFPVFCGHGRKGKGQGPGHVTRALPPSFIRHVGIERRRPENIPRPWRLKKLAANQSST